MCLLIKYGMKNIKMLNSTFKTIVLEAYKYYSTKKKIELKKTILDYVFLTDS